MRVSTRHLIIPSIFLVIISSVVLADVLLYDRNAYVKFVGSDVGLTQAYTEYQICNPTFLDKITTKKSLQHFDWEFYEMEGKLTDSWFEIKVNRTYKEKAFDSVTTCDPYYTPNETYIENCMTTFKEKTVKKWGWFWEKFDPTKFNYKSKECYNIRIYGTYPVAYKENRIKIDNVISFAGYRFEEYAWWNAVWDYAVPLTTDQSYNDHRYLVKLNDEDFDYAHAQADGADFRVVDGGCQNASSVEMDIWLENITATNSTFWFIGNNHTRTDYCLYYGNAGASTVSSGTATFGNFIDNETTSGWTTDGCTVVTDPVDNTYLKVECTPTGVRYAYRTENSPYSTYAIEMQLYQQNVDNDFPDCRIVDGDYTTAFMRFGIPESDANNNWASGWSYTRVGAWVENVDRIMKFIINESDTSAGMSYYQQDMERTTINSRENVGDTGGAVSDADLFWLGQQNKPGGLYYRMRWVFWRPYVSPEPTVSVGAEIEAVSIALTTLRPDNITYTTTSIVINASTDLSGNVTWSENGGANQTMRNASTQFENTTTLAEGTHDIFVYAVLATDDKGVDSNQTFFTIDLTPPVITIVNPTGTNQTNATIPLDFVVSDAWSSISTCMYSLNNASNTTIAGCANLTFAVTQAGTHNITVYANDTNDWEGEDSTSFTYDPLQNFTANDSMTADQIQDFQVLIIETGASGSTTNGTVPISSSAVGYGVRTLRFIASGYNTTEFAMTFTNESLLTENFTLVPAVVNITVLDEGDAGLGVTTNIIFNITISNVTQSNTWYNQSAFFKYANETASGDMTISISSYGYQPREYYVTINENIANDFTAYLLKSTDALFVRFHVLTTEGLGISGAEVSAQRLISGTWVLIEEKTADDAGIAGLSLAPFASYKVTASATGYVTQVQSITPSASDYYFYMASSVDIDYHVLFEDITYFVTPQDPSIQTNVSYDMVLNISSSNNTLEWYSMNITYNDTTAVFFLNVTGSAEGGNITYELNSTYSSGNYTMEIKFKKTDYGEWTGQYHYQIRNFVTRVGSLWYFLQQFAASDAPPMFKHLVAIFTAFASAGVASKMGMRGGGVLAGIVLIIWTGAGWFSWNIMLLTVLSVLAVYALKEGL